MLEEEEVVITAPSQGPAIRGGGAVITSFTI